MKYKNGRYSQREKRIIIDNTTAGISPEDTARQINRDPEMIHAKIKEWIPDVDINHVQKVTSNNDVRCKEFWSTLQQQFDDEELVMFEYHWRKICEQFNNDIQPTEELQIVDTIKLELLMNKNLKKNRELEQTMLSQRKKIEQLEKIDEPNSDDITQINHARDEYNFCLELQSKISKEYRDLATQKDKMFAGLRSKRSDRIDKIENSKINFLGWIGTLLEDEKKRREAGLFMEKRRIASQLEYERLTQFHTYNDKKVDIPILNYEVVERLKKDGKEAISEALEAQAESGENDDIKLSELEGPEIHGVESESQTERPSQMSDA